MKEDFSRELLSRRPASLLLWTAARGLLSGPVVTRRGADGSESPEYDTDADVKSFLPK